jgi:hypothetical protein
MGRARGEAVSVLESHGHRRRLNAIFEDSGSVRAFVQENLARIYREAARDALSEMGRYQGLPVHCPWTVENILDTDFLPGPL